MTCSIQTTTSTLLERQLPYSKSPGRLFHVKSALNRLATQKSPYLLQHKENPVDWFPWGDEAFAKAKAEDKPIFLSIGYSTCHWCHVMEHESFVDPKVAEILNAHFVSIKVDREERPDVDHVYMTFIQATTGHGGWPMSVWLTPDLKPFYGGTYFAPKPAHGRPAFASVLERIAEQWKSNRSQLADRGDALLKALKESEDEIDAAVLSGNGSKLLADLLKLYSQIFDSGNGGFGNAPKFPRCVNQELLMFAAVAPFLEDDDRRTARGMALHTLHSMSRGGIYDHLAGGFHRYSVDAKWHVPHFEKMLYDQAQLVSNFVIAYQLTGDDDFSRVVHETLRYVSQDLSNNEGLTGFFSAEDADSLPNSESTEKLEGAFYVWRHQEVSEALGEVRWRFFNAFYDLEPDGNVAPELDPHEELAGQNILHQQLSLEEAARRFGFRLAEMEQTWQESRAVLLARRGLRPRPLLDDKVLTSWNGLMIAAFAQAYRVLGAVNHLNTAKAAANFVKQELFDPKTGEIQRSFRLGACDIPGYASDYAALIHGLIELYQADFDIEWLVWAEQLQGTLDRLFWDEANGGYYSTTDRDPSILLRMKEDYDGAEPTPSSLAARNLWRLGHLLNRQDYLDKAKRTVDEFRARLQKQPYSMPLMVVSAGLLELAPRHLILHVPEGDEASLQPFLELLRKDYRPNLVVIRVSNAAERAHFSKHEVVAGLPKGVAQTTAYLCQDYACQLPVTEPAALGI